LPHPVLAYSLKLVQNITADPAEQRQPERPPRSLRGRSGLDMSPATRRHEDKMTRRFSGKTTSSRHFERSRR
jgi:hypothetical protein